MLSATPTFKAIEDVLFLLPSKKTYGINRVFAEALPKIWPLMKNFYLATVHKFWKNEVLAEIITEGMIGLILKTINHINFKDWRPLTMLSTDYKIILKFLLAGFNCFFQHSFQIGFIKDLSLFENAMTLWMAEDAAKACNIKGLFVKFDF